MTSQRRLALLTTCCLLAVVVSVPATAVTIKVNELAPTPGLGVWGEALLAGAGTISLENLTGVGGNLENNQPLPIGAGLLTTGDDNSDRAEVAIGTEIDASTLLNTGVLGYSYYKETVTGTNTFAAPSLKLTILAPDFAGDGFGTLVYEPTWNQPGGGSQVVPADDWQTVSINSSDGEGDDSSGGWWWTGGLGEPNTAGGPPIRSLGEWASLFQANAGSAFDTAQVIGVSVGVGTFNLNQVGYFDNVSITIPGGTSTTYNFEPIPEPASMALLGIVGMTLLVGYRRR